MSAFSTRFGVSTKPSRAGSSPSSASSFLISSCILLFYISVFAPSAVAQGASADDPDRLYANRADLASARRAADLWKAELQKNPKSYEAAWKLSRTFYWLGGHAPEAESRAFFEAGVEAGKTAAAIEPNKPEGHFFIAANMGTLAESFGIRAGLKYRKPIKEELETVLRIDAPYRQGSADRALGRWYHQVPGLFGGDKKLAERHLLAALKYNPNSTITHFFLAELYLDWGRKPEGRAELQKVIDAPEDPEWAPEDRDYKAKAKNRLAAAR